ncbi:MAG: NAD-dependent epimerase/dehydratase family protein [Planctomycetes bacterium]|nr:NAD-dependent epimerase/dehydratase family protein [Planctomycetota bacterium]
MPETTHPESRARRSLVTGGAGFIGSHLSERLLARGDRVTVIDNLSTGRTRNLPDHPRLRFIEADLHEALHALGPGEVFDEIYHLAAAVGVGLVMKDPVAAIRTNIEQTIALLEFAAGRSAPGAASCGIPTLIASSSEVYGKSAKSPYSEGDDVTYGPTTVSRWSYAYSKGIDEYLALSYGIQRGLPVVIARFFNTVGPRQVGDYGMVLPRFVEAALGGKPLRVHGEGRQSRCFCDIADVVDALPKLMTNPACRGGVFNVGSDRSISIRELAELVIRLTGSGSSIELVPYSEAYPPGFEDLADRRPDLRKIRGAIGFEPRKSLENTIRDVAGWLSTSGKVDQGHRL